MQKPMRKDTMIDTASKDMLHYTCSIICYYKRYNDSKAHAFGSPISPISITDDIVALVYQWVWKL